MRRFNIFMLLLLISLSTVYPQEKDTILLSQNEARLLLLKSVILPGWGEHSLGYNKRGFTLNSSEASLWILYGAFSFLYQSHWNDMKAYAALHADVNPVGKDAVYFTDVGNYMSIYDYHDQKARYNQSVYFYNDVESNYWAWESEAAKDEFDDMRYSALSLKQNASFVVAALITNRILSMIDVIALTKDRVERPDSEWNASFIPGTSVATFSLNYSF